MINIESLLSNLTNEIRVHGAIAILGAGISFEAGKCFSETNFKEKLTMYKKLYIDEFKKVGSIKECDCEFSEKYRNEDIYVKFCDDLLADYKGKIDLFEKLFDGLISVYVTHTEGNILNAYKKLDEYYNEYCTRYSSSNALQFCDILFRGRSHGEYDIGNIYEYYHIPFSKKNLAGSQRFSIAGEPILYLAKSIPTAIQEVGCKSNNINFCVYYPKFSWFYESGIYNITNSIDITLNNCIYPMIADGSKINYDNYQFTFSKKNADIVIGDSILFQVLTFPINEEREKKEEYILPQMFTKHLKEKGYIGLIYQSTKNINQFKEDLRYKCLDYNYCFFVSKEGENDYNEQLLNCFYAKCIGQCKTDVTINDINDLLDKCRNILIKMNKEYIMDEYIMLRRNIEKHIELMKKISSDKIRYYDADPGNNEVQLIYELIKQVKEVIENPGKYDIRPR